MAVPLAVFSQGAASGRAGRVKTLGATGSLVLGRMDRRGLVRAKKHGTKSGPGAAPLRRGFFEGGRSDYLLSWT